MTTEAVTEWRGRADETRSVLSVSGPDAETFLQGLLSNDVRSAQPGAPLYAAILTPQGKYLFDMVAFRPAPETFLLDVALTRRAALAQRLGLYKLRAKVAIEPIDLSVAALWPKDAPESAADEAPPLKDVVDAGPDPRAAALGWRALVADPATALSDVGAGESADYAARRLALGVPETGSDLVAEETFPLDADFERLQGVDFKKGCYVGQEVTARMKHKADRKKRLYRLAFDGLAPAPGAAITADGKPAGVLGSVVAGAGLAVLRVDRASGALAVGEATAEATPFD